MKTVELNTLYFHCFLLLQVTLLTVILVYYVYYIYHSVVIMDVVEVLQRRSRHVDVSILATWEQVRKTVRWMSVMNLLQCLLLKNETAPPLINVSMNITLLTCYIHVHIAGRHDFEIDNNVFVSQDIRTLRGVTLFLLTMRCVIVLRVNRTVASSAALLTHTLSSLLWPTVNTNSSNTSNKRC